MARKRAKNLLLDANALNDGEDYCRHHGTTLSRLVSDFLLALPRLYAREEARMPIVQRLMTVANYGPMGTDTYSDYLYKRLKEVDRGDYGE